jgi:hypothetical protein
LVGTAGVLKSASDAVEALFHIVGLLPYHELSYSLEVAVASSNEDNITNDIIVVEFHLNELAASAMRGINGTVIGHDIQEFIPLPASCW